MSRQVFLMVSPYRKDAYLGLLNKLTTEVFYFSVVKRYQAIILVSPHPHLPAPTDLWLYFALARDVLQAEHFIASPGAHPKKT